MMVHVLQMAEADLADGYDFYELQAPGVGTYFLDTMASELHSLRLYAGLHRKMHGYYRMISRRFPYAVFYKMVSDGVEVWRVLDCRRDPRWITRQLKSGRRVV